MITLIGKSMVVQPDCSAATLMVARRMMNKNMREYIYDLTSRVAEKIIERIEVWAGLSTGFAPLKGFHAFRSCIRGQVDGSAKLSC